MTSRHIGKSGASPMHTATPWRRITAATSAVNQLRWRSSSACPTPGHAASASQNSSSRGTLHWKLLGSCHTTAASFSRSGCTWSRSRTIDSSQALSRL